MRRQSLIKKLSESDSTFNKQIASLIEKPELNPLTESEQQLAIAIFGNLKTMDHSWNVQTAAAFNNVSSSSPGIEDLQEIINEDIYKSFLLLSELQHQKPISHPEIEATV